MHCKYSADGHKITRVLRTQVVGVTMNDASTRNDPTTSDVKVLSLPPEKDDGNEEYKWKLTNLSELQISHRVTQMQFRLNEGKGVAKYRLGYLDNGEAKGMTTTELEESLETIKEIIGRLPSCTYKIEEVSTHGTATIIVNQLKSSCKVPQIRIPIAGNVSSGKSTLLSVVGKGILDNGRGLARNQIFQHNHEFRSGHTSSITTHNMYFDKDGRVLNLDRRARRCEDTGNAVSESSPGASGDDGARRQRSYNGLELTDENITHRMVSLIDLAGHEKYLKTTLHGLVGMRPDYCMLTFCAKPEDCEASSDMTGEHLGIISAISLPFFIVITKSDKVSTAAMGKFEASLINLVNHTLHRQALPLHNVYEVWSADLLDPQNVPIIITSSLSGNASTSHENRHLNTYLY